MAGQTADAVVIGAGPNGLVAANALVDAGWDVVRAGGQRRGRRRGAQRRGDRTRVRHRPVQRLLPAGGRLPGDPRPATSSDHGLVWEQARDVLAHALDDGRAAVLSPQAGAHRRRAWTRSRRATARPGWSCSSSGSGSVTRCWTRCSPRSPRSPRPCGCCAGLGTAGTVDLARLAVMPVRRLGQERFRGAGAALLLDRQRDAQRRAAGRGRQRRVRLAAGDARPGRRVPGARAAARSSSRPRCSGGSSPAAGRCAPAPGSRRSSCPAAGRSGCRLADGTTVRARKAVLADVPAPALYRDLVGAQHLPARFVRDLDTVPVGQRHPQGQLGARPAGALAGRRRPRRRHRAPRRRLRRARRLRRRPVGGPGAGAAVRAVRADDHRRPDPLPGRHRVGLGLHPRAARRGLDRAAARRRTSQRVEDAVERVAPGFRGHRGGPARAGARRPARRADANLVGGAINAGTVGPAPAAVLPAHPGARPARDAGARPLPRRRLGAPRRRGARRLRLERRPRGAGVVRPGRRGQGPPGAHGLSGIFRDVR